MFTGIVTDLGHVRSLEKTGDTRIEITTSYDLSTVEIGASICCSGACMTVIEMGEDWFAVQASGETVSKTIIGDWAVGSRVNLERSLKMGDEMGGHIVSGHVDGTGEVVSITPEGESHRVVFRVPESLKLYIAPKGSIAIDGVSLTVNEVENDTFGVNIIPHTWDVTTFGAYQPGTRVNLEIDMLARYVARLMEKD
ncbi:MAG: riboflavin synthase [Magnetovibrionaceae bacterium]